MVHKPAELSPLTARLLMEIAEDAGLPPGVWNLVNGFGEDAGRALTHALPAGRGAWLQVVRGALRLGDMALGEGDGVALVDEDTLTLRADEDAEFLLFDLA